jgi:hypothetical protein
LLVFDQKGAGISMIKGEVCLDSGI